MAKGNLCRRSGCARKLQAVHSEDEKLIGWRCVIGHTQGLTKDRIRRERCEGCGSSIEGKHATGCYVAVVAVELNLQNAYLVSNSARTNDDEWAYAQSLVETVLGVGSPRTGGQL